MANSAVPKETSAKEMRLVIGASSLGTIFEWYDFFIYGTLAAIIGKTFFPSDNATLETLLVWAGFAVGFGFRPLGAILFGFLGDKLGRKYTFLVTVTLMGVATAGVGLVPSAGAIGYAAPALILLLRILQGLALGGEYGGAAIYVAEHSPPERRGFFTSFIQASVVGGFVLSLIVVLSCKYLMPVDVWESWGWRVPFLLSLLLLAFSLWMRLKLTESPVFLAMKAEGEIAGNPFTESFTYPGNKKRIFVALIGVAAGLTVIWYTAMFTGLTFLKGPMRVEDTAAEIIVGIGAALGMVFFIYFGKLSDKIGRKMPILVGYAITLAALFPLFWLMGSAANPDLAAAAERAPIVVTGTDCTYNPFVKEQVSDCAKLLDYLTKKGAAYQTVQGAQPGDAVNLIEPPAPESFPGLYLKIGGKSIATGDIKVIDAALADAGYNFDKQMPTVKGIAIIVFSLVGLSALSGATYGPVAALLSEMFPPKIRYSSMSIPYHFGTGYFGGFLPFISSYIVARTGDPYAGLWYTWVVVALALLVALWGLKGGAPRDFEEA
jgi:MFS family permease